MQSYFVDHQEAPAFMSFDIPTSLLNAEKITISEDQSDAIGVAPPVALLTKCMAVLGTAPSLDRVFMLMALQEVQPQLALEKP